MANAPYRNFKKLLLDGDVDLVVDDLRVAIIDEADYTFDAAHTNLSQVPGAARVAVSGTIQNRSITIDGSGNAVFDADDTTINTVTGDPAEALIVFKQGASDAASPLLFFMNRQADGTTPLSLLPNGGNVTVEWSNGATKLVRLS